LDGIHNSDRVTGGFASRYVGPAGDFTSYLIYRDELPVEWTSFVLELGVYTNILIVSEFAVYSCPCVVSRSWLLLLDEVCCDVSFFSFALTRCLARFGSLGINMLTKFSPIALPA